MEIGIYHFRLKRKMPLSLSNSIGFAQFPLLKVSENGKNTQWEKLCLFSAKNCREIRS